MSGASTIKKSARGPPTPFMFPSVVDQPPIARISDVSDNVMQYMSRVSTEEEHVHKYAPNTMFTNIHKTQSPYHHTVYMSSESNGIKELCIPVVDSVVTLSDYVKGARPLKFTQNYDENVARDHSGIDRFTGNFEQFVEQFSINSLDFPTVYSVRYSDGQPLLHIVNHLITVLDLQVFGLDKSLLTNYLVTLTSGYSTDAPYHNALHACDVVVTMGYMLRNTAVLMDNLSDTESK